MMVTMPRTRMGGLVRRQERDYGQGLVSTRIFVNPAEWQVYKEICDELGITAAAGVRQMVRRFVKGYERNG